MCVTVPKLSSDTCMSVHTAAVQLDMVCMLTCTYFSMELHVYVAHSVRVRKRGREREGGEERWKGRGREGKRDGEGEGGGQERVFNGVSAAGCYNTQGCQI